VSFRWPCKKDFLGPCSRLGTVRSRVWIALVEC
jgi:hypothetical protein